MKKKKATAQKKRVKHGQQRKNNIKRTQNSAKQQKKNSAGKTKSGSVAQQKKNTVQQKKSNVEQPKKGSAGQAKVSAEQLKKSSAGQPKVSAEKLKKSGAEQPKKKGTEQSTKSGAGQPKVSAEQLIKSNAGQPKVSAEQIEKSGAGQPKVSAEQIEKSNAEQPKVSAEQLKKSSAGQPKVSAEQLKKSSTSQKKNKSNQKQGSTEQRKDSEDQKKSSTGQRNSSFVQKKGNAERRKGKPEQKTGEWKEILYNCPYVLGIVFTSLLVMLWSDEIGFKAIAREAQTVMVQSGMIGNSGQTEQEKHLLLEADDELSADKPESEAGNEDVLENNSEIDDNLEENAGKRKGESNDKENDNNLQNDINNEENIENTEESQRIGKGITKFEIYDPQEIDSIYYSDAGKVALTTEYPYTKENIGYFHDAAFLGDSRTLGISDYAGLEEADFYCDSGMMIFKLLEEKITYQKTGDKVDLNQVLQEKQYGKIYIMLGMNELGYGNTEMYLEQYRKVLNQIKEWQPQAIIYVMANLHVSREKNNLETEFNNININDKNAASAQLANGTDIFYLDVNPLFTDSDGFLNADLSFDGVHLYAQHYDVWREFLLEHAVEPVEVAEE
ncbi:MAG: hypothetical protein HDR09_13590 [Lachnospiraceae bacterium]|nr:hypothetical protein [Lachnospiraceae bacterium]